MATVVHAVSVSLLLSFVWCAPGSYDSYDFSRLRKNVRRSDLNNEREPLVSFRSLNDSNGKKVVVPQIIPLPQVHRLENGVLKILNTSPLRGKRGTYSAPDIVFPGPIKGGDTYNTNNKRWERDECDESKHFCENVSNYPISEIMQAVEKLDVNLNAYFGVDSISDANGIEIGQRNDVGNEVHELGLCDSIQRVSFPRRGQDDKGNWKTIINYEGKEQGVFVEECTNEKASCRIEGVLSNGYEAICKQKYVSRRLITFIEGANSTAFENIKMPGCCKCYLRPTSVGSGFTNSGRPRSKRSSMSPLKIKRVSNS